MTLSEIKNLYKDIFDLTIEDIVDINVDEEIKKYKAEDLLHNDEITFEAFVGLLITFCIIKIHGPEELMKKDTKEMYELINDFYLRHLKKITKTFTSKYGVSMNENELNVSARIIKYGKEL